MPIELVQARAELVELHEQAIAKAWLWHRPHTVFIHNRMPVTRFGNNLTGIALENYRDQLLQEWCSTLPCEAR